MIKLFYIDKNAYRFSVNIRNLTRKIDLITNTERKTMQKIISDIFDKINAEIPDWEEKEKTIEEQIDQILSEIQKEIPEKYHDEVGKRLFEISAVAEKKGFELGFKYMAKLFVESLS